MPVPGSSPVINPMAQHAYWQEKFRHEPYYRDGLSYDDYGAAYRVGYTGPLRREGRFQALEEKLHNDWEAVKGRSRLDWAEARQAVRAAWDRATRREGPTDS